MRFPFVAAGPLLVVVLAALPLPAAGAGASRFVLDVTNAGKPFSTETFTKTAGDGGRIRYTGEVDVVGRPPGVLVTTELTVREDHDFDGYSLVARPRTGVPPQRVGAEREGNRIRIWGEAPGATRDRTLTVDGPAFLVDNTIQSFLAPLAERLLSERSELLRYEALIPQTLEKVSFGVRRAARETGTLDGKPVRVILFRIEISNTRLELRASADAPAALLEVVLPRQQTLALRRGFVRGATVDEKTVALPQGVREIEVTIGRGPFAVPGTLTIPKGKERFPAVVLVAGAGVQDRDETIGPNKPFRDFAWGLAERGVAVLRYDKRTFAHAGALRTAPVGLVEETIDDAAAAVALLAARPEVDPRRVSVAGHSLGGFALPEILARSPGAAGGILLGAPSRPVDVTIPEQIDHVGHVRQEPTFSLEGRIEETKRAFARIRSGVAPDEERLLDAPARYWRDLLSRDPAPALAREKRPILLLRGSRDFQSTAKDVALWTSEAEKAGKANFGVRTLPGLNNLFQPVELPSDGTDYLRPGRVSAAAIDAVAEFAQEPGKS